MRPPIIKKTSTTNKEKLTDLLNYTRRIDDCCIWKGAKNSDGYAHMLGNVKVHRLVYELATGEDIKGLVIRHKCDTPLCINPKHLEVGTASQNTKDRCIRGRTHSHVSEEEIKVVDALLQKGITQTRIAEMLNVSRKRIEYIKLKLIR